MRKRMRRFVVGAGMVSGVLLPLLLIIAPPASATDGTTTCFASSSQGYCCKCSSYNSPCGIIRANGNTECTTHLCEPSPCFLD